VTPGFMDRMMAIAKANPDVGTITPLSNNGEFTSFPEPFVANELASLSRIREIDAIAEGTADTNATAEATDGNEIASEDDANADDSNEGDETGAEENPIG